MNSILQCLSNTEELRDYCLSNVHRYDLHSSANAKANASATLTEGTETGSSAGGPAEAAAELLSLNPGSGLQSLLS